MLFDQNIASNVTRNQESKHITNLNLAHKTMQNHSEQLLGTYRKPSKPKQEIFDFHKKSFKKN